MKKTIITSQELRELGIPTPYTLVTNEDGSPMAFELTSVSPKNGDSNTLLFAVKGIEGAIAITDLNKGRLIKKITGKNESDITPTEKRLLYPVLRKLLAQGQNTVTIAKRAKFEDDTRVEGVEVNGERTEWRGDTIYLVDNILGEDAFDMFEEQVYKPHNQAAIKEEAKELAMAKAASSNGKVRREASPVIVEEPALVAAGATVVEEAVPAAAEAATE
jgi:hypothetical protein